MTDQEIIKKYIDIAKVVGEMFSPFLEVLVHDFSNPRNSIVEIINGHITGRKKGGAPTELGKKRMKGEDIPDVLVNYQNESPKGSALKSSSIAIRNNKKLIGSICFNLDVAPFIQVKDIFERLSSSTYSDVVGKKEGINYLNSSNSIKHLIQEVMATNSLNFRTLSSEDKRFIVKELNKKGAFKLRGIVTILSKELKVTRASIYGYLK